MEFRGLGVLGFGFRGLGFRGLGFRGLGFRGPGFRVHQAAVGKHPREAKIPPQAAPITWDPSVDTTTSQSVNSK